MREVLRQILGAMVILIIAFLILRPALKSALKPSLQIAGVPSRALAAGANRSAPIGRAAGDADIESALDEDDTPVRRTAPALDKKLSVAREAAKEDPKRVAQLMKQWVGDE